MLYNRFVDYREVRRLNRPEFSGHLNSWENEVMENVDKAKRKTAPKYPFEMRERTVMFGHAIDVLAELVNDLYARDRSLFCGLSELHPALARDNAMYVDIAEPVLAACSINQRRLVSPNSPTRITDSVRWSK